MYTKQKYIIQAALNLKIPVINVLSVLIDNLSNIKPFVIKKKNTVQI